MPTPPVSPQRIIAMASAFYDSQVLFAATDAGVFAALAELDDGAADAKTLAQKLSLNKRGARLLLDACVAVNLLTKEDGQYRNTAESAVFLSPRSPADLSQAIRYNRDVYAAWGKLGDFVRTGEPVEKPTLHLGEDEERTRTFVMSMHGRALGIGRAVVPQLNLADCQRLLDVGGGPGTFSVLIAQANPTISCTVLDLPPVVAIATELIAAAGMSERVQTCPGDYHTADFPSSNDAILFSGMLHQESPESIRDLLARGYAALNPGGVVYIMDMMTDATHTSPKFSALFGLNMALTTDNGWVFSEAELNGWLQEAGFVDFAVSPLAPPMPHWLASARKVRSRTGIIAAKVSPLTND